MSSHIFDLVENFADIDCTLSDFHRTCYRVPEGAIAFIHLPKTGGSSVHRFFFGVNAKGFRFWNIKEAGIHLPVSRCCPPGQTRYFTVFRNPVERVWSYYKMVKHRWKNHPYTLMAEKGLEFFLVNCWEARNQAVRYYSSYLIREPSEIELDIATANLEKFHRIIRFEVMGKELLEYALDLGIAHPASSIPHINKSQYDLPALTEKRLIASYNQLDLMLSKRLGMDALRD